MAPLDKRDRADLGESSALIRCSRSAPTGMSVDPAVGGLRPRSERSVCFAAYSSVSPIACAPRVRCEAALVRNRQRSGNAERSVIRPSRPPCGTRGNTAARLCHGKTNSIRRHIRVPCEWPGHPGTRSRRRTSCTCSTRPSTSAPTRGGGEGGAIGTVVALGVVVHVGGRLAAGRARPMRALTGATVMSFEPTLSASHFLEPRP